MRGKRNLGDSLFDWGNVLLMVFICFITLYPIWYVLINSFNDGVDAMRGGIYWYPRVFSLESYEAVFKNKGLMTSMGVTVAKTVIGTVVHVLFTAMVAYGVSRKDLIGKNIYMLIGTVTMFFGGGLIPSYLLIRDLHLLDTFGFISFQRCLASSILLFFSRSSAIFLKVWKKRRKLMERMI